MTPFDTAGMDTAEATSAVASALAPAPSLAVEPGKQSPHVASISRPRFRFGVLTLSHLVVDLYPMFIVSLVAVLQYRLTLTETQAASLIAINGVVSGLSQPLFAWIGDRFNTRMFGALGLAVGAMALSSIGFAQSYTQLVILQTIGMGGIGVFHPISSALAGRLGHDAFHNEGSKRSARSVGLAVFFAAGVAGGGFLGPLLATRINAQTLFSVDGLHLLSFMMIPGIVMAIILWMVTKSVPHRTNEMSYDADSALDAIASETVRWFAVALLFCSNTLRFTVNMGLYYLYKRWAEGQIPASVDDAANAVSKLHANTIAASALGMGISALIVSRLVSHGGERRAMVLTALLSAPIVMLMPILGSTGMILAAGLVAFGYFSIIPTSLSLAQRLLPHATGATGGILMGCGWAISGAGPLLAAWVVNRFDLTTAFIVFGLILALAGVVSAMLSKRLIRAAAEIR
jgi:MFS transporter, FSR family, fosmidomycin resistance protein